MKKTIKVSLSIILFLGIIILFTIGIKVNLENKLKVKYNDIIEKNVSKISSVEKSQGVYIQNKVIENNDVILYGSSELSMTFIPEHPNNLYLDKKVNYNISLVGREHCQDIIHAINIGALEKSEKNRKLVIILSPQWFIKEGIISEGFEANFSELQFYKLMNNKELSEKLKIQISNRINKILARTSKFNGIKLHTMLYSKNNIVSKVGLGVLKPYYLIKEEVLQILDLKQSLDIVNKVKDTKKENEKYKDINWNYEMKKAEEDGKKAATNNDYGIYDDYFNKYIKDRYGKLKNHNKDTNYTESYEYDDLNLLIQVCKELKLDPLLVSTPVHGKWSDYTNFNKNNRDEYYNKIREISSRNKVKLLDLSKYEYEKYFLCDVMHLGWKGWVHINEGIDQYYNGN